MITLQYYSLSKDGTGFVAQSRTQVIAADDVSYLAHVSGAARRADLVEIVGSGFREVWRRYGGYWLPHDDEFVAAGEMLSGAA